LRAPVDYFRICPVRSDLDLLATVALFEAYAASLGIDLAYQDFAGELAAMPGKYAPPAGELLLARGPDGVLLGCVGLRPLPPDSCCEIKRLYVVPAARGLGLGRALLRAIMGVAGRIGYREVRLDTLPDMTEAIALYRHAGFALIAAYYDSPVAGTVFLGRSLGAEQDRARGSGCA
jgi:ribosomal protein S18 acetylase RimI-like enzyme